MTAAIRPCRQADAASICAIYNHHVVNTVVTFEETPVANEEMARRIDEIGAAWPWLVCEERGTVAGYAYAAPWKARSAYRFSVETTVYLEPSFFRRGIGTRLYQALIDELKNGDAHCAVGGIALPNPASVALHEKLGFAKIGHFKEVGCKFGRWIDVGYWELIL
jgi:L-amino acid N-acyltransferase YncA